MAEEGHSSDHGTHKWVKAKYGWNLFDKNGDKIVFENSGLWGGVSGQKGVAPSKFGWEKSDNPRIVHANKEDVPEEIRSQYPDADKFQIICLSGPEGVFEFYGFKEGPRTLGSSTARRDPLSGGGVAADPRIFIGIEDAFDHIPVAVGKEMLFKIANKDIGVSLDPNQKDSSIETEAHIRLQKIIRGEAKPDKEIEDQILNALERLGLRITKPIKETIPRALWNKPDPELQDSIKFVPMFWHEWTGEKYIEEMGWSPSEIPELSEALEAMRGVDVTLFQHRLADIREGLQYMDHIIANLRFHGSIPPVIKIAGTKKFRKEAEKIAKKFMENKMAVVHTLAAPAKASYDFDTMLNNFQAYHNLLNVEKGGESIIESLFMQPGNYKRLRRMLEHMAWTVGGGQMMGSTGYDEGPLREFQQHPIAAALGKVRWLVGSLENQMGISRERPSQQPIDPREMHELEKRMGKVLQHFATLGPTKKKEIMSGYERQLAEHNIRRG